MKDKINLKKIEKEIQDILKKNKSNMNFKMSFPTYNILPDEVMLALKVLGKHQMRISFTLEQK